MPWTVAVLGKRIIREEDDPNTPQISHSEEQDGDESGPYKRIRRSSDDDQSVADNTNQSQQKESPLSQPDLDQPLSQKERNFYEKVLWGEEVMPEDKGYYRVINNLKYRYAVEEIGKVVYFKKPSK